MADPVVVALVQVRQKLLALPPGKVITMPFADYADFAECVDKNGDKDDPQAFCGWLKHRIEGSDPPAVQLSYRDKLQLLLEADWDPLKHPRDASGRFGEGEGGQGTESTKEHGEYYDNPKDALKSLLNGESANVAREDVRDFVKAAGKKDKLKTADLTDLHVDGKLIFGGNGLGIDRKHMPQIPKELRGDFLKDLARQGIKVEKAYRDPLKLSPTQTGISAARTNEKLQKYEDDPKRPFPPILISEDGHVLDGHHHWAAMAVTAIDHPRARIPVYIVKTNVARALASMHQFDVKHKIKPEPLGAHDVTTERWDLEAEEEAWPPRPDY